MSFKLAIYITNNKLTKIEKDFIELSKKSTHYQIKKIIIDEQSNKASFNPLKLFKLLFFACINFFDKLFGKGIKHLNNHHQSFLTTSANIPIQYFSSQSSNDQCSSFKKDILLLKDQNLDFIISFGNSFNQNNLHKASNLGLLNVHYGKITNTYNLNKYIGFFETLNKISTTSFNIRHQGNCKLPRSSYSSASITTFFPFRLNSMRVQRKSLFFLNKFLENINYDEIVFDQKYLEVMSMNSEYNPPSIMDSFRYLIQAITILSKSLYMKVFNHAGRWSIGYFKLDDINNIKIRNLKIIKNHPDQFLADPFLFEKDNSIYCFAEDYSYSSRIGKIRAFLLQDNDAIDLGIALEESFHLSYPNIFSINDEVFMCPETSENKDIRLYKSTNFPMKWSFHKSLIQDISAADTNIFYYDGRWWLFTNIDSSDLDDHCSELHIFYSDAFDSSNWIAHKKNPVIANSQKSRNAGLIEYQDTIYRNFQVQDYNFYGKSFGLSKIIQLDTDNYIEEILDTIDPTFLKNIRGSHHFSYINGMAAIDFYRHENIKK